VPHLGLVALVVADYDEAIAYYVNVLGFELLEDTRIDADKRWVVVAPRGAHETALLLARAATPYQRTRIGDQTGGRVGMFLYTDDFQHLIGLRADLAQDHLGLREGGLSAAPGSERAGVQIQ
jgi:catechol 2,3-dioxygenase-like lactoylglutathione lyase family enzyme